MNTTAPFALFGLAALGAAMQQVGTTAGPPSAGAPPPLVVGPAGSGAQFAQVSEALAVASSGDTVLVLAGSYEPFEVDKGITILGAGHGAVVVDQRPGVSAVRIAGIDAGETAQVSGLSIRTDPAGIAKVPEIDVTDNQGSVVLSDVHAGTLLFIGSPGIGAHPTARIEDSASVLLDGCTLRGTYPWKSLTDAQVALEVLSSSVWISDATLSGGDGSIPLCVCPLEDEGAAAIRATSSSLVIARSEIRGGTGGNYYDKYEPSFSYGYDAGNAIDLLDSELLLAGGPGNLVQGGGTTWECYELPCFNPDPEQGVGIQAGGSSTVRVASDAVVLNGPDWFGGVAPGGFEIATTSTLVREAHPLPTIDAAPTLAAPGMPLELSISGTPNALHLVFLAPALGPPRSLSSIAGPLALPLFGSTYVAAVRTDGSGLGSLGCSSPSVVAVGTRYVLQSLELGPFGTHASNPTSLTIR